MKMATQQHAQYCSLEKQTICLAARLRRCPFGALLKQHCPTLQANATSQGHDRAADGAGPAAQPADGHCTISSQPESAPAAQNTRTLEGKESEPNCPGPSTEQCNLDQNRIGKDARAESDLQGVREPCEGFIPRHESQQGAQVLIKQEVAPI